MGQRLPLEVRLCLVATYVLTKICMLLEGCWVGEFREMRVHKERMDADV